MTDISKSNPPKMNERLSALEKELVRAILSDRKHDRRWRNIRVFSIIFILLVYAILIFTPATSPIVEDTPNKPYAALVRLDGIILPGSNFSARRVIPLLEEAFKDDDAKGVVLVINSPGGSPVQASIIHDKILQLKQKYKKKVVVEGVDLLASGAYLISTAADKIYVHPDTLTGSIGVIMSGFGLTDAIAKVGVTRRVIVAGQNKDRMDPFRPLTPEDIDKTKRMLQEAHQHFINDVVQGRGNKLKGDRQKLFSGDVWNGSESVRLGLADGTANLWDILRKEFNVKHYRTFSEKPALFHKLFEDLGTKIGVYFSTHTPVLKAQYGAN